MCIFSVFRSKTIKCNDVEAPFITNLKSFHFLRFNTVILFYVSGSQSIDLKLNILHYQLQLFKTAFNDLERIILIACINQNDQTQFHNHSQLLDHLRKQLLPICDSSPCYWFHIDFQSDNDASVNVLGQILQLLSISRCRTVLLHYANETFIQLPVEDISNWLNRNSNNEIGCTRTGQSEKERLLCMNNRIRIQNAVEMCDHLKTVITFHFIFNFKIVKKVIQIL